MTREKSTILAAAVLGVSVWSAGLVYGEPATFSVDQKIEVREGDEWSGATITKKEGRKYQVKYDDGTEEWVTTDRLRSPGEKSADSATDSKDATDTKADGAKPDASKPADKKAPLPAFAAGAKIQVKDNSTWRDATVINKRGEWYLIEYAAPWKGWREWAEPWRVRKPGSTYDFEGWFRNPRVNNNEGPPTAKPGPAPVPGEKKDPFAPKTYDKPVTDVNVSKVDELLPTGGEKSLKTFDPVPETPKLSERAYVLKGKSSFGNAPSRIIFGGATGICVYHTSAGGDTKTGQIEVLNLASGRGNNPIDFDPLSNPIAVSGTGKRVLGRAHGFFGGTRNRVDLFDLPASGEPKHIVSFVPYTDNNKSNIDVEWAGFVDDDKVLILSKGGTLALWDAPKAAEVWSMPIDGNVEPAFSPGGKQLAVMTSDGLAVLEPATGKVLCSIDGARPVSSLDFSPDGKRVVGSTGSVVASWDLEKGELAGDIGLPVDGTRGDALAVDSNNVLIGGSDLLDLTRKTVVWKYTGSIGPRAEMHRGLVFACVNDGQRTLLTTAKLPHATVAKALTTVAPPRMALKPGDTISIEVAAEGTEEQRAKIANALTTQLNRNGVKVAPGSPIKLVARTEQGKSTTTTYNTTKFQFGGPAVRGQETVTVTEKITRISLEADGKIAWENRTTSGGYAPMSVQAREGQSINDAVQSSSQYNLRFLETVRVPVYVPQPGDQSNVGQSRWSMGGVKDDK